MSFKICYKLIPVDLSKQQPLDADSEEIQHIDVKGKLDQAGRRTIFFFIEEAKETIIDFSQGTVSVL